MAIYKADKYPLCLWISIGGALAGSLQFGYHVGVLNTAITDVEKDLDYDDDAVLSSALVLGAALGAIIAGKVADMLGPRRAQLLNSVPFAVGALLAAASQQRIAFLTGRVISGIAAGAASLYTPRYIAEISPTVLRGRLGSQSQVFINVGILLAYLLGVPYEHAFHGVTIAGHYVAWWRIMLIAGLLPAAGQVALLLAAPESPVWLEGVGEREAADEACIYLWGSYAIVPDPEPEDSAILLPPEEADRSRCAEGWAGLLKPQYRWMLALALGLPLLQQASGINTIIFYSSLVFRRTGLASPVLGSILVGALNLAVTALAASLMDRWGRRPLLQASFGGMAISLALVAGTTYLPVSHAVAGGLTALLILAYVSAFALGAGPIPWVVISEVLPPRIKGPAASLATAACWAGNLLVTLSFDAATSALGLGGVYLLYALLNAVGLWFVSAYMLETKCASMEEIEAMLLLPAAGGDGAGGGGGGGGGGAGHGGGGRAGRDARTHWPTGASGAFGQGVNGWRHEAAGGPGGVGAREALLGGQQ